MMQRGSPTARSVEGGPVLQINDAVRTRNINPPTHTRLPRYARDKPGVIVLLHGTHVFPDTNALFQGENPQPLDIVKFRAQDLWGSAASPRDTVCIDLWEDYLEPARPRWITFAAQECQGWTPSGRYSSWDDLEYGIKVYREAGGTNAMLANVAVDLAGRPESAGLADVATSLACPPDEARRRIKRMEQLGFDEVLLVSHSSVLEDIERVRDFL